MREWALSARHWPVVTYHVRNLAGTDQILTIIIAKPNVIFSKFFSDELDYIDHQL